MLEFNGSACMYLTDMHECIQCIYVHRQACMNMKVCSIMEFHYFWHSVSKEFLEIHNFIVCGIPKFCNLLNFVTSVTKFHCNGIPLIFE